MVNKFDLATKSFFKYKFFKKLSNMISLQRIVNNKSVSSSFVKSFLSSQASGTILYIIIK